MLDTTPTVADIIRMTDKISAQLFKDEGHVCPVYVAFLADGDTHAVNLNEGFKNDYTKDRINLILRIASKACFKEKQIGGVLVTEGYMATLPRYVRHLDLADVKRHYDKFGPASKLPGRVEAILYMAEARTPTGVQRALGSRPIDEVTRALGDLKIMEQKFTEKDIGEGFRQIGYGILGD